MKKMDARIRVGTKVKLKGLDEWTVVIDINQKRSLLETKLYQGWFPANNIETFTNKKDYFSE